MPSSYDLSSLPDKNSLSRLCQALAALDAILCPDWEDRYYSYDSDWSDGEQLASMRNGCGDTWRACFTPGGVIIFGLDHECAAYRQSEPHPEILGDVAEVFSQSVAEPAFDTGHISFCLWQESGKAWQRGAVEALGDDGSARLLAILDGKASTYRAFAADYFECELAAADVQQVYDHKPLTADLVRALNPDAELEDLTEDLAEIGYPSHGAG